MENFLFCAVFEGAFCLNIDKISVSTIRNCVSVLLLAGILFKSGREIMRYTLDISRYTNIVYIGMYLLA